MSNVLKIIITAILIIAANIAMHFLPQWTDQIFMVWLVAVLLTVTWERSSIDYTGAFDLGFRFGRITGSEQYSGPPLRCPDGPTYRRRRDEILGVAEGVDND